MQLEVAVGERPAATSCTGGWCLQLSQRWSLVQAIVIAQLLSVSLAATGVFSEALSNQGINAPTTQAFLNYVLLAVVFGTAEIAVPATRRVLALWRRCMNRSSSNSNGSDGSGVGICSDAFDFRSNNSSSNGHRPATRAACRRLLVFAALALLDVEANTLVTKAYQYTSLTSVTLLDCFTIPCVMLLSWGMLHTQHHAGHFAGAACCIAGLAVLVLGDSQNTAPAGGQGLAYGSAAAAATSIAPGPSRALVDSAASSTGSAPLLGDSLVLLGAVLYSVCNVTQELLLGDVTASQLLAFLGVFGALISGLQALLLERHVLQSVQWTQFSVLGPMAGFAASMFLFYSAVPRVLILGGATVLNLSLLTSDAWSALARFVWFGGFEGSTAAFFVASLLLVAAGIAVYAVSGSPKEQHQHHKRDGCAAAGEGDGGGPAPSTGLGRDIAYSRVPDVADEAEGQLQLQHEQEQQQRQQRWSLEQA